MKTTELREYSILTWALERIFRLLQKLSIATWLMGTRVDAQKEFFKGSTEVMEAHRAEITKRRGRQIEFYVTAWLITELVLVFLANKNNSQPYLGYRLIDILQINLNINWIIAFLASYRLIDILQASLNLNLFDRLRIKESQIFVATIARTAILSIWNFFESIICFGLIYACNQQHLKHSCASIDSLDPYYFSVITQLTIGYGDIVPMDFLRGIAMSQGALGFILGVFAISRVISFLPKTPSVLGDE